MTPAKILLALSLATVVFAFVGDRVSCDSNIGFVVSIVAGAFAGASAGLATSGRCRLVQYLELWPHLGEHG